jgi:hypothetical protein
MPEYCYESQNGRVRFKGKSQSEYIDVFCSKVPIYVEITSVSENLINSPGRQNACEYYQVGFRRITDNYTISCDSYDNEGTFSQQCSSSSHHFDNTSTVDEILYLPGPIGGASWVFVPGTQAGYYQLQIIAGKSDYVINPVSGDHELACIQNYAYLFGAYKSAYPSIVTDERGKKTKLLYDQPVYFRDTVEITSVRALSGGNIVGATIKIYSDNQKVFERTLEEEIEYVVDCGGDCASDEIKIWVNRSSNTFMCCKCCNH